MPSKTVNGTPWLYVVFVATSPSGFFYCLKMSMIFLKNCFKVVLQKCFNQSVCSVLLWMLFNLFLSKCIWVGKRLLCWKFVYCAWSAMVSGFWKFFGCKWFLCALCMLMCSDSQWCSMLDSFSGCWHSSCCTRVLGRLCPWAPLNFLTCFDE